MSANNGGRGTPPVPPEGHEPPQQTPITKRVIQLARGTSAQRVEDGASISFLVLDGGQLVEQTYLIGEPGKKAILEELAGGITLP